MTLHPSRYLRHEKGSVTLPSRRDRIRHATSDTRPHPSRYLRHETASVTLPLTRKLPASVANGLITSASLPDDDDDDDDDEEDESQAPPGPPSDGRQGEGVVVSVVVLPRAVWSLPVGSATGGRRGCDGGCDGGCGGGKSC